MQRIVGRLADDKLIQKPRKGAPWTLTDKGNEAIGQPKAADATPKDQQPPAPKPVVPPPTEAEIDAEITRHNALPEKLRDPDRLIAANRLGIRANAFEKLAKDARKAAAPVPAEASEANAPEPTEAEIEAELERLAEMSDAAFLSIDREAVAKRLRCTPDELAMLRRRAQAAKVKAAKAQAAKKTVIVAKTIAARAKKAGHSKKDGVTTIIAAKAVNSKPAKAAVTPRGKHPSPKDKL